MLLLVAVMGASGFVLSRGVGPRDRRAEATTAGSSGVLFCPHGGDRGWHGWVVITNPGTGPVSVRVTSFGATGSRQVADFSVGGSRQVFQQVPASEPASSTEVESFGGRVGAAAVISSVSGPALAAERCVPAARPLWVLPDEASEAGQSALAVVMNPFSQTAEFNVVIRTEKRTVSPGELTPFVLPAGRSTAIALNRFLLMDQSERTLSVQIVPMAGRIIAGGTVVSAHSIRAEGGVPFLQRTWVIPAAGYQGAASLAVANPRGRRADLSVVAQGRAEARVASGQNGLSLDPAEVATVQLDQPPNAGVVLSSANHQPVAAALRVDGPHGGTETIVGSPWSARGWLVLPSVPPSGGQGFVILENPGPRAVRAQLSLIGAKGPASSGPASVTVRAATTVEVPLREIVGLDPVSVVVRVQGGGVVAAGAASLPDGAGFATTLGVPLAALG